MKPKKVLFWAPRILGIIFVLFMSIFAFDVFGEGYGFWMAIGALFIHLIPTFVLIALLYVAWRWEFWGGIAFIVLSIVFTFFFKTYEDIINFFLISFPVLVIGVLFLLEYTTTSK